MADQPTTSKNTTVKELLSSTPPPLADIGLCSTRRVTEMSNRRFKLPKKLVACSKDDELFVKRPQFSKSTLKNPPEDEEMEEEADKNEMTDLEVSNTLPIVQRFVAN